jgi:hypothetical protein
MATGQIVIFNRLTNGATGVRLGSTSGVPRVYPLHQRIQFPKNKYVVYFRNQTNPTPTKATTSVVDEETYIIQCFAKDYDECVAIADDVRTDLDRCPEQLYSGVYLMGSNFENQTDPEYDEKTGLFDCEVEFLLRIRRSGSIPN